MYWLTTVDNESTTNVRLITKGRSFSSENTSVIKNPIDCNNDAWQRDESAAIKRNGHTLVSLKDSFDRIISAFFFEWSYFWKCKEYSKSRNKSTHSKKIKWQRF